MRCSVSAQARNGAPLIRDRSTLGVRNGPGSAAHHFVLRRARDTSSSSLPGLTPQVGFTRLAALQYAQLGQARVACNPLPSSKSFLRRKWTRPNRVYPIWAIKMRKSDESDLRGQARG